MTPYPMKTGDEWVVSNRARESLEQCDLFRDLDTPQLMEIAALVEEYEIEPDELLLRKGDPALQVFVIIESRGVAQLEMYRRLVIPGAGGS